jgi:hypothetical protein
MSRRESLSGVLEKACSVLRFYILLSGLPTARLKALFFGRSFEEWLYKLFKPKVSGLDSHDPSRDYSKCCMEEAAGNRRIDPATNGLCKTIKPRNATHVSRLIATNSRISTSSPLPFISRRSHSYPYPYPYFILTTSTHTPGTLLKSDLYVLFFLPRRFLSF